MKMVARFITRPSEDPMNDKTKPDMGFISFSINNDIIKSNHIYEIIDINGTLVIKDKGESGLGMVAGQSHPGLGSNIGWAYTISHIFSSLGTLMYLTWDELNELYGSIVER